MGKWKYLNFLIILVILFFMFNTLAGRYHASLGTYLLVVGAIVLLTAAGYYVFVVNISRRKTQDDPGNNTVQRETPSPIKPRPKVVLKPRNQNHE